MSSISEEHLRKIAQLARLKLNDDSLEAHAPHLKKIFDYFAQLTELETEDVEPMSHPADRQNAIREDLVTDSVSLEDALKNAAESDGRFFLVPRILEKG